MLYCFRQRLDQPHRHLDLFGVVEAVVHDGLGEHRHHHEGGVLGLFLLRGPDQAAPALGQHRVGVPAHHAGIRDELDQGIAFALIIILRHIQLVLQRRARLGVLIGHQLELRRDLGDHRLQLGVGGLVRLAAAAHPAAAAFAVGAAAHAPPGPVVLGKGHHARCHHRNRKHHANQTLHIRFPPLRHPDLRLRCTIPCDLQVSPCCDTMIFAQP